MRTNPKTDSQIHREGKTIVRQLDAARNQLGNLLLHREGWEGQLLDIGNQLCTLIVDVAAICTDDGSNADIRAFLTDAEVRLPEEFLIEL